MFSKKYNQLFHESSSWKKLTIFSGVLVTPELAAELLRMNDNNRPIRTGLVKAYAQDMKNSKWEFNGDSIRISRTQRLLDGQHRLLAIIESGTTQIFNIQSGLPDEVFDVIDTGRLRSAADAVSVKGYKNAQVISGAIKLIKALENGSIRTQAQGGSAAAKTTNQEVIEYLEKKVDMELLQECATMANKWAYKAKFFSPQTYCAFGYLFSMKDRDLAYLFFDLLSTGDSIGKKNYSPIFLLRQKLINTQQGNTQIQTMDKYALLIKAWNFFIKSKEIGQLAWHTKEEFPKIDK